MASYFFIYVAEDLVNLRVVERFLIDLLLSHVLEVLDEVLRYVSGQENHLRHFELAPQVLRLASVEGPHLLQDLDAVLLGHLEVRQNNADGPVAGQRLREELRDAVDDLLAVAAEGCLAEKAQLRDLILNHSQVDQLVLRYHNAAQARK